MHIFYASLFFVLFCLQVQVRRLCMRAVINTSSRSSVYARQRRFYRSGQSCSIPVLWVLWLPSSPPAPHQTSVTRVTRPGSVLDSTRQWSGQGPHLMSDKDFSQKPWMDPALTIEERMAAASAAMVRAYTSCPIFTYADCGVPLRIR